MNARTGVVLLSLCSCLSVIPAARAQSPALRPQVVSIKGFTFDNDAGKLSSEDMLVEGYPGMWNQVQNDGLLVVVEVSGEPYASFYRKADRKYRVQLTASAGHTGARKVTLVRPIHTLNEAGKRYLSFMVYDNQCSYTKLVATVIGPGPSKPFEVFASANCGE